MMNNPGSKSLYYSVRIKYSDHLLTGRKRKQKEKKMFFTFNIAGLYSFAFHLQSQAMLCS